VAARQVYTPVQVQLRQLAVEARREGVDFEAFWQRAVRPGLPPVTFRTPPERVPAGAVRFPNDTLDRTIAQAVHADPRVIEGWRCAYERRESRAWAWAGPLSAALDLDGSTDVLRVAA
jgi:hypothetical protein